MSRSVSALSLALLSVAAPLALGACIIHTDSSSERSGRYVSAETLRQIEPGRSQEYVIALIGDPTTRTSVQGGVEIWKWTYSERTRREDKLIFIFSGENTSDVAGAAYVEFRDGLVTKAWQD